jgi:hypothetical protein
MSITSDVIEGVSATTKSGAELFSNSVGAASDFIRANPVTAGVTLAGGLAAGATIVQVIKKKKSTSTKTKKKSKTKKKTTKKKKSGSTKRKSKQKKPYTAGKGKDTSTRRIRYTKNNQPYVILKSGKARFIKKSSVSRARKRKGGRY